jgi:uncharacterized membrane protein YphA (DoxX/SURF4 family)
VRITSKPQTIELLLRIGVAFSFIYPPISAFFNPYSWVGYIPQFAAVLPIETVALLHIFGIGELIIGAWILFGKKIFIPSILASVFLALIIGFNWTQMDVLFRDIPILLMALCLALLHTRKD